MPLRHMILFLSPKSLTSRLTLFYALAFFLFLGISFVVLYLSIGAVLDKRIDDDLHEDIEEFSTLLATAGLIATQKEMDRETYAGEHESVFLLLFRKDSTMVHGTDLEFWNDFKLDPSLVERQFADPDDSIIQTASLADQEADTRIIYGSLSPEYVLVIGESTEEKEDIMELLAVAFGLVFLFTLPLASLLVWMLSRRAIVGIQSVSKAALDISSGNLDRRVNAQNQVVEVQTLADTFDAMAQRIQTLIRNMREMTDNIAHDLRSPLGRVRLLSESVLQSSSSLSSYQRAAQDTITECDRLINMINMSLDVAETEAGVTHGARETFDLTLLVEDACDLFETVAEEKSIVLEKKLAQGCTIEGDVTSIQRMVANVIDNAVKYTPADGNILVELLLEDDVSVLNIYDSGIGIPVEDYENIFSRFFRIEPSRSSDGCGLGLSYARAVARSHGGDIRVRSQVGRRTVFTIRLPVVARASLFQPILPGVVTGS